MPEAFKKVRKMCWADFFFFFFFLMGVKLNRLFVSVLVFHM